MKIKFWLIIFPLTFLTVFSHAQHTHRCEVPLPDYVFRQKQKSVSIQPNDKLKLQVATAIALNNCLSVQQVKILSSLFLDDLSRLDFAKAAWHTTVDKENFYFVYDEFANFSTVFMLRDYVTAMEVHPEDFKPPYHAETDLYFPPYDYPFAADYHGPSKCTMPMGEKEFNRLAEQLTGNSEESSRLIVLNKACRNTCLSVSQAMKLASLLNSETNRLSFFRNALPSIYDLDNLSYGAQLFSHIPNKAVYNEMIHEQVPGRNEPPPCKIEPEEFKQIKESIGKESFNNTKLTLAKQIIRSKHCFTTQQVTGLVRLFNFDETRLELAKFAFDFTLDQDNYYQVADALTFSSSKEDLMKFLGSRH